MRGNEIIVSAFPQGKFIEGVIADASLPGTIMEIVPKTALTWTLPGGRQAYRASSATTGARREILVLRENHLEGKGPTDAYVPGTRGFLYVPAPGEDINILTAAEPGTGSVDTFKPGDLLGVNSSGLAVPNSAYISTPFTVQEYLTQVPADTPTLLWVQVSGPASA
jgi:hypothetical protein